MPHLIVLWPYLFMPIKFVITLPSWFGTTKVWFLSNAVHDEAVYFADTFCITGNQTDPFCCTCKHKISTFLQYSYIFLDSINIACMKLHVRLICTTQVTLCNLVIKHGLPLKLELTGFVDACPPKITMPCIYFNKSWWALD